MSILSELRKYSKSKEYETILTKYKNKIESIVAIITLWYQEWKVDKSLKYSEKDLVFEKYKICEEIIPLIKDENTWINLYKSQLEKQKKRCIDIICYTLKDEKGELQSHLKYTEFDLKTKKIQYYSDLLELELNWLINQYTKQKDDTTLAIY